MNQLDVLEVRVSPRITENEIYICEFKKKFNVSFVASSIIFSHNKQGSNIFPINHIYNMVCSHSFLVLEFINHFRIKFKLSCKEDEEDAKFLSKSFKEYKSSLYSIKGQINSEHLTRYSHAINNMIILFYDAFKEERKSFPKSGYSLIIFHQVKKSRLCISWRIVSSKIEEHYEKCKEIIISRELFLITALAYHKCDGGILLRRGYISSDNQKHMEFETELELLYIGNMDNQKSISKYNYLIIPFEDSEQFKKRIKIQRRVYNEIIFFKNDIKGLSYKNTEKIFNNTFRNDIFLCIKEILNHSLRAASMLTDENKAVIVEDSKSMRISFLLIPTIKIMIDHKYTTINGFINLIKTEFLNYGFSFWKDACFMYLKKTKFSYFFLWAMTMSYLLKKHPTLFEFDEALLDILLNHIYSGHYFPFAHPSYFDKPFKRCANIFDEIISKKENFINKKYEKNDFIGTVPENYLQSFSTVDQDDMESSDLFEFYEMWKLKCIKITQLSDFYFQIEGNTTESLIEDKDSNMKDISAKIIQI